MLSISSSCNFLLHRRLSLLIGESYRFVVGVASIGVGGGAWGSRRCFYSSNSSNYNNNKNVSKIWAASILGEEAKEAKQKNNYTKSTLLGLGEASSTQDLKGLLVKGHEERVEGDNRKGQTKESNNNNNSRGGKTTKGVYRRRMTDSTWTTMPMDDKLIWVDCEMTGLDVNSEMIMEIGCIITDQNLKEIAFQPSVIVHVPEEKLLKMGPWCVDHHGESGLTEACRQSKLRSEDVDAQLLEFVQRYTTAGECPMAGNSIYMDRMFISKQFPLFHGHFHYRNVDVSTLKELIRRWYPDQYSKAPKKKFAHRVIQDIRDSIDELKYYRESVFKDVRETVNEELRF